MKISEIMDAIADALSAVIGTDGQVAGRMNFAPAEFPSIDVYPSDPFRGDRIRGFGQIGGEYLFTVRARINTPDHEGAQNMLLRLMDDEDELCVAAALMEDQTLNGVATSVDVAGPSGYVRYADAGVEGAWLGCEWRVTLVPARS